MLQEKTLPINTLSTGVGRSWALPERKPSMRMKWHDLAFLNWCVGSEDLLRHLPAGLELDTFDGQAWISVVPFVMSGVAPTWLPDVPWLSKFPELNVRTYVVRDGKPGVWFFTLDATNPLAVRVARSWFHLNYVDARIRTERNANWIKYRSERTDRVAPAAELAVDYRPVGESYYAEPGTLVDWLTSRYCLYAANKKGAIFRGEIDHAPWQLRDAQAVIHTNSMLEALGISIFGEPASIQFAKRTEVVAWSLDKID